MSKKMLKRSLALGALMAFVITGSAWAAAVENTATGTNAIAIGHSTVKASDNDTIAIGNGAKAGKDDNSAAAAIAAGYKAQSTGNASIAVGREANATTSSATAIGDKAKASGTYSNAIGVEATAIGTDSIAFGTKSKADATYSTAIGYSANAKAHSAIAIGERTTAGYLGVAIGQGAIADTGNNNVALAIGYQANATADGTIAVGRFAKAAGNSSVAFGASTIAEQPRTTAIGYEAQATNRSDLALGSHAITEAVHSVDSVNIGGNTYNIAGISNDNNFVAAASFGGGSSTTASDKKTIYRQLQYVAAGQVSETSTDAVNGSQLYAAYQGIDKLATEKADVTYVDEQLALKANAADVYTKEQAEERFLDQNEADARYVQIGSQEKVETDENGNTVSTTTTTEISSNFIVEDTKDEATGNTSTKVTINEGDKAQLVVGGGEQSDKIVFGQQSSWYTDQKGFFFGGGDGVHNDDTANAYIKEDGSIMGAKGKFKVDTEGNVTGGTYNGIDVVGMNQRLDRTNTKVNKVGAGAAALAALHPLEYDPDDKLTFSAGMGNYAGENAAALGAFYRPNEKFMVSLGGTMGNGENMVNLGLSIGLDKPNGLAKLSKRELIQKVNAVEAENDALEDRVAKLEALVAQLANK